MSSFKDFQDKLYSYYCKNTQNPLGRENFERAIVEYKNRKDKYLVYLGYSKKDKEHNTVIYVGTTIQMPISRWYYHYSHGKDLEFVEAFRFDNSQDMLDKEYELIKKYRPCMNKITDRKQNFNVTLSLEEIENRKGNSEWCQCCLKRRVRPGYKLCYFCSTKS